MQSIIFATLSRSFVHQLFHRHISLSQFLHLCQIFSLQSMLVILPAGFILWPALRYSVSMKLISMLVSSQPLGPQEKRGPSEKSVISMTEVGGLPQLLLATLQGDSDCVLLTGTVYKKVLLTQISILPVSNNATHSSSTGRTGTSSHSLLLVPGSFLIICCRLALETHDPNQNSPARCTSRLLFTIAISFSQSVFMYFVTT